MRSFLVFLSHYNSVVTFFLCTFAPAFEAQMAESVDALVSNTSGATRAGSTPALGTGRKKQVLQLSFCSTIFVLADRHKIIYHGKFLICLYIPTFSLLFSDYL